MKIGKLKVTKAATGLLLCVFTCAALLFSACEGILDKPETDPVKAGYGKLRIQLVNEEPPFALENGARTAIPSFPNNLVWTYTATERLGATPTMTPNATTGVFTLPNGTYTITVQGKNASSYLILEGKAENVVVATGAPADVKIEVKMADSNTTNDGSFTLKIGFPVGATVTAYLSGKNNTVFGSTPLVLDTTSGGSSTTTFSSYDAGSYLLRLIVSYNGQTASVVEAVHIYPVLSITYEKIFTADDFIGATPIKSVAIGIPRPLSGVAANTITSTSVTGGGITFTATDVTWKDKDNTTVTSANFATASAPYKARIKLTPLAGFTFFDGSNTTLTSAKINDTTVVLNDADPAKNTWEKDSDGSSIVLIETFADAFTVASISIKTPPQTVYTSGEKLDLSKLVLAITYSAGTGGGTREVSFADFSTITGLSAGLTITDDDGGTSYVSGTTPLTVVDPADYTTSLTPYIVAITYSGKSINPITLTVNKKNLATSSGVSISISPDSYEYTGLPINPTLVTVKDGDTTLIEDTGASGDFVLSYDNITNVGKQAKVTVTGIGNYTGIKSEYFTIYDKDTSLLQFSFTGTLTYTSNPVNPTGWTVTENGVPLTPANDYFSDNIASIPNNLKTNPGKVEVTFTGLAGKPYYGKTVKATYTISKKPLTTSMVTVVAPDSLTYNGNEITAKGITVVDATVPNLPGLQTGNKLVLGQHYMVSYGDNKNVTGADVVIKLKGFGDYYDDQTEITATPTYEIAKKTPTADDFVTHTRTFTGDNTKNAVALADLKLANTNLTGLGGISGTLSYNGSTTVPTNAGSYALTATVAAGDNFAAGTAVGKLIIEQAAPVKSYFVLPAADATNYTGTAKGLVAGSTLTAATTPIDLSASSGLINAITAIKYQQGSSSATTNAPVNAGNYTVLVDIGANANFIPTNNVEIGTYVISKVDPELTHFDVKFGTSDWSDVEDTDGNLSVIAGDTTGVNAKLKVSPTEFTGDGGSYAAFQGVSASSSGTTPSKDFPTAKGTYRVTVEVPGGTNFNKGSVFVGYLFVK